MQLFSTALDENELDHPTHHRRSKRTVLRQLGDILQRACAFVRSGQCLPADGNLNLSQRMKFNS